MINSSLPQKILQIYRQESKQAIFRRIILKLRNRWARLVLLSSEQPIALQAISEQAQTTPHRTALISVDVIICIHNAHNDVKRCLESLADCQDPRTRLLLIDDGSAEETASFVQAYASAKNLRLIRNDAARGYTYAANQGLRASTADCVVLLNSDTIVTPGWLDKMLAVMASDPRIGIVGPLSNTASWQSIPYIEEDGDWKSNAIPESLSLNGYAETLSRLMPKHHAEVGFINGFCMLLRREIIEDVGLFDEDTFGRGYGEENDFCLRAHKKDWKLAVCLQAYVFHAQSKSYSNERRIQLCLDADRLLDAKHGSRLKHKQLARTMAHPLLQFGRTASEEAEVLHHTYAQITKNYQSRKILFLLPAGHSGGGSNVVIAEARALRQAGVDAWIANLPHNRKTFQASYYNLDIPCCYFNLEDSGALALQTKGFDAVIATHNTSAHWLADLWQQDPEQLLHLGYYVQDYEPLFYRKDKKGWKIAYDSYLLKAPLRRFCKTQWTADIVYAKAGVACTPIGPSIDAIQFSPSSHQLDPGSDSSAPVTIAAMIRTSCERRQPDITAKVLQKLHDHFGNSVRLLSFGSSDADLLALGIKPGQSFTNLGRLSPVAVAALMHDTDLFIDASEFQAMGLTAMEAMASGCIVVGPSKGGLPEIIGEDGEPLATCIDTSSPDIMLGACIELIQDKKTMKIRAERSLQVSRYHPAIAASRMLDLLFNDA